jgi:NAD(P)H dehydrogenase (quinone)
MKKILIMLANPDKNSFNGKLAKAYEEGAKKSGNKVKFLALGDLKFDPILHKGYKEIQALEPDLLSAQESIKWADHIALFYPTWWGTMPAILKGFFDRIFLPGFAFSFHKKGSGWDKLLKGRTAHIIATMDSLPLINCLILRGASERIISTGTFGFCGIKTKKKIKIGAVKNFSDEKKEKWVGKMKELGGRLS